MDWFEERWKECDVLQPDDISNYRSRWEQNKPQPGFKSIINGINISAFEPLEGRENILEAFRVMCKTLTEGAQKIPNVPISTPGRKGWSTDEKRQDVYRQHEHGFWFSFRSPETNNKFWNGFGLDDLGQKNTSFSKLIVEINPPLKSKVGVGGKNGGALFCDTQGNRYLGHTGKINKVPDFLNQYMKQTGQGNIATVKCSKKIIKIILLGRIDSFDLKRKVSEFIRAVEKIKSDPANNKK